jgi:hypothetical protein
MSSAISAWEKPSTVKQLQSYIGFIKFLRRLVSGFSKLIEPIQRLLVITMKINKKSSQRITWNKDTDLRFSEIKEKFTELEGTRIHMPLNSEQLLLKTNTSNVAVGTVLFSIDGCDYVNVENKSHNEILQKEDTKLWGFVSRFLKPNKKNHQRLTEN